MQRRFPLWLGILILVVVLAAAAVAGVYWRIRASQPQLDGSLSLAALDAPVEVVRDGRGVAHITAQNLHDLYVAQGFVMAQDRLWQMDLMRRLGEGKLAEVFGPKALPLDEASRGLGLAHTVAAEASRLDPGEKSLLEAFAAGVNANMTRRRHRLPLAFALAGYRPEAWRPEDTLAMAAYMYQVLASGYRDKLLRETFAAKLGPELAQQLFPDRSPWDVIPGGVLPPAAQQEPRRRVSSGGADGERGEAWLHGRQLGGALSASGRTLPEIEARTPSDHRERPGQKVASHLPPAFGAATPVFPLQADELRGGSNDWVVSGDHSFSGKPILANDPHLSFQIPGLWWAVQLTAPGIHVAGVAITGVPGVIIGHNDHIAWGVTNTRADVQDLFREKLDGKGHVLTPRGWQPLQYWHEHILVKGAKAVDVSIPVTPHGPIVAHDSGGALALDWSMYAPGALQSTHVFLALDEARNWQEFRAALAQFPGPAQNFVYADTAGNIGYQCAGWVPLRPAGGGVMPVPANDPRFAWQGWIPFVQLPSVENPRTGILATANSRITPDAYPYVISTDWDSPNRTRRIYQLLEQLPKWNASAMGRVQQDVISEQDANFAAALLAAAANEREHGTQLSAATREALGRLRDFHGAMGHASEAPTLAYEARLEFLRRVVAGQAGYGLARVFKWDEAPVFEQWLLDTRPAQWLPPEYATRGWDALLTDSLADVVQRYTMEAAQLHWGNFETLSVKHPVYSHIPFLGRYSDLGPVEINGSPLTVKQARNTALGDPSDLGPSMRFIADTGDWDHSTLTLVAGESGVLFSPHYRDQFKAYLEGQGVPLWFSPQAVAAHRQHGLRLVPGS